MRNILELFGKIFGRKKIKTKQIAPDSYTISNCNYSDYVYSDCVIADSNTECNVEVFSDVLSDIDECSEYSDTYTTGISETQSDIEVSLNPLWST